MPAVDDRTPTYAPNPRATLFAETISQGAVQEADTLARSRSLPVPNLPGYRINRVLGAGGMGVVYAGVQLRTDRDVAIKVIHRHGVMDGGRRQRFEREARALGRLSHPQIVTVYDGGEENGLPYLAMEYVDGGTLTERIRKEHQLPARDAVTILAQVCDGVSAAHAAGVLHRDIKPSNILLASDGTAKVADFGLAKLMLEEADSMTESGAMVGTPSYMAPEQVVNGPSKACVQSDVYGLGATLYHALAGFPPFDAGSPMATALRVRSESPAELAQHIPGICPILDAIVSRAMARNIEDRYDSAVSLAQDLRAWLAGEPTQVRPLTPWQRRRRWLARHRKLVAAAILLPCLAAGGVVAKEEADARKRSADAQAKREADPLWQLEQAMRRGDSFTCVPEQGPPVYSDWLGNAAVLTTKIDLAQGAAGFQTSDSSKLVLVPDTIVDHYRISLEMKHVNTPPGARRGRIGVFFKMLPDNTDGWVTAKRYITIQYTDYITPLDILVPEVLRDRSVMLDDKGELWTEHYVTSHKYHTETHLYPPANSTNPPWHKMIIDVSPEGIEVHWGDLVNVQPAIRVTRSVLKMNHDSMTHSLSLRAEKFLKVKGATPPPPEWGARAMFGVQSLESTIAFRNVILTPLNALPSH